MQYKFFVIPIKSNDDAAEEMNRFLRAHRVLAVEKRFMEGGENPCWSFCVEYLEGAAAAAAPAKGGPKVDYKEVLSEVDFSLFSRLLDLRKTLAEKDAVPAYAIFTNEQLAQMVQTHVATKAALGAIAGIGDSRIAKYGESFLNLLKEAGELRKDGVIS